MATTGGDFNALPMEATAHDPRARAWLEKLMRRDGPGILRLLWRMLQVEQDVMDAYQDCFCKLAQRGRFNDLHSARAYAYRTAANIAVEMIRTRMRHRRHWPALAEARREAARHESGRDNGASAGESEPSADSQAPHAALWNALARLPAHLRNVVVLRDLNQLSYAEVGKILMIAPATARVYRRHAVVRLAEFMKEEERDDAPRD
ncbi:MAG: sigma-70 family RNA polymerase sigma factor [Phycisphaerae bacterium]|nr:sigma-70 family RNA polymerase sigma factor [Phycisphaerae bacterium]